MLKLIIKLFVKNSENVTDQRVRERYGVVLSGYGIFLNILLFAIKYVAGILSASIAMTADAFNNLSDAGSSLISVIGFKFAGKKPDPDHPYGHGRIEYIAGLIVSLAIILMGYEIVRDSFKKIIHPEDINFSYVSVAILLAGVLVKLYMSFYLRHYGKLIDSAVLTATATDALSDTISTATVILATVLYAVFGWRLDGYSGLLVGALIIFAGLKSAKETVSPLLGEPPTAEFIDKVEAIVTSYDEIQGMHDLMVHNYGPGRLIISLHAEVPDSGNINELHDVIDNAEARLSRELNCSAVIHMDPVRVGDPFTDSLKEMVKGIAASMDEKMTIHDFRIVTGPTHTNLIFDVLVPFHVKMSDDEVVENIKKEVYKNDKKFNCVVTIDRDYVNR